MEQKIFGTDGIRAKMGTAPLTQENLFRLGKAIGHWFTEKYGHKGTILLGHDTRESSYALKAALKSGLLLQKIGIADADILPTPAIALICKKIEFNLGIMITASHNPYHDNGIKLIDSSGEKLHENDEKKITDLFYNETSSKDTYTTFGGEMNFQQEGYLVYANAIKKLFGQGFLSGLTIVLDCANGATYAIAKEIFTEQGATIITIGDKPNGKNINKHCGATNPHSLQKAMIKYKADIGFAFDGDGDRLAVVNKKGQIKDGDDILCILADHPSYKNETSIVGTVITNYGLESYLQDKGKKLIRTNVGDKFVTHTLKEQNLLLGGEHSGHIIMKDYLHSSDGIYAALKIMETIQYTQNWELKTFKKFPQVMINVSIKQKKNLELQPFASIISEHKAKLKNGAIVVRYSGTENLLRVVVQEENEHIANDICLRLSEKLKIELN